MRPDDYDDELDRFDVARRNSRFGDSRGAERRRKRHPSSPHTPHHPDPAAQQPLNGHGDPVDEIADPDGQED